MKTIKINNLEISVEELQRVIKNNPDLLKPEVKGRYFFPKVGETYWWITEFGNIVYSTYKIGNVDNYRISIGNCYRTEEEAELALKKQQAIVRCWKWQQENAPFEPDYNQTQLKYFPYYAHEYFEFRIGFEDGMHSQFTLPHFKSSEDCNTFIQANKEDLLLFTK